MFRGMAGSLKILAAEDRRNSVELLKLPFAGAGVDDSSES